MKTLLIFSIAIIILFVGCEKKIEPVKVGEMNEYKDPAFGFKVKYPQEWKNHGQAGRAIFALSQEVINKLMDPRSGIEGAVVTVEVIRYEGRTSEEIIQTAKNELKQMNADISPDAQVPVGGKTATQIPYRIQATTKTSIFGHIDFVSGDTAMYKLEFQGYGDQYAAHVPLFDAITKSFELPVIVTKKPDQWNPSGNMETYNSNFFTMIYPDNLEFVTVKKAAKDDFAMEMRADRLDCSIHIDVFGAQKLTVDKVWEQNKKRYNAKATGQIQIDAENASWADYSPRKDIGSRVYFVVKNDKVVRITINYFAQQKDIYFPTFENMVKSIKIK
ncbi:MAG: hypothetical protein HY800_06400 [Ignavibacteriales bacterium]|nr:hypothetical protein [Ignavibacteriales bacterium]